MSGRARPQLGRDESRELWLAVAVVASLMHPVVDVWQKNALVDVRVRDAFVESIVVALAVVSLAYIAGRLVHDVPCSMIVTLVLALFFVHWEYLRGRARPPSTLPSNLEHAFAGALLIAALALVTRLGTRPVFISALGAFSIAMTLVAGGSVVYRTLRSAPEGVRSGARVMAGDSVSSADAYIIVLDGFGRPDLLKEVYGVDLGPLTAFLRARGFSPLPGALSNYSNTILSVPSMLTMDYPMTEGEFGSGHVRSLLDVLRGRNGVVASFKGAGFSYVHIDSGWYGTSCGPAADRCLDAPFPNDVEWSVLSRTAISGLAERRFGHPFLRGSLHTLARLEELGSAEAHAPRFIFAHVLLPHPPSVADERCSILLDPRLNALSVGSSDRRLLELRRAGYARQVGCVSAQLMKVIGRIPDEAAVLLIADHGPDSLVDLQGPWPRWPPEALAERFAIFSAMRAPGSCPGDIAHRITAVNVVRRFVSCVLDADLDPIDDAHYLLQTPDAGGRDRVTRVRVRASPLGFQERSGEAPTTR